VPTLTASGLRKAAKTNSTKETNSDHGKDDPTRDPKKLHFAATSERFERITSAPWTLPWSASPSLTRAIQFQHERASEIGAWLADAQVGWS
jgi:hypothetical protein